MTRQLVPNTIVWYPLYRSEIEKRKDEAYKEDCSGIRLLPLHATVMPWTLHQAVQGMWCGSAGSLRLRKPRTVLIGAGRSHIRASVLSLYVHPMPAYKRRRPVVAGEEQKEDLGV